MNFNIKKIIIKWNHFNNLCCIKKNLIQSSEMKIQIKKITKKKINDFLRSDHKKKTARKEMAPQVRKLEPSSNDKSEIQKIRLGIVNRWRPRRTTPKSNTYIIYVGK